MKIVRMDGDVQQSRLHAKVGFFNQKAKIKISELPEGLKNKMADLLNKLTGVKTIDLSDRETANAVIKLADKNVTIDAFDQDTKEEFVRTIDLLRWYLEKHWITHHPEYIGAASYCNDCNNIALPGSGEYCDNPDCSSHKKWQEAIGPAYEAPKQTKSIFDF